MENGPMRSEINYRTPYGGSMTKLRLATFAVLVAILAIGLSFSPLLSAQTLSSTAALSGTVSDPAGARVAKATVKLTNPEKGITRVTKADSAGEYSFALLPVGTYSIEASAPGFKTTRQDGIVLNVGDSLVENIGLTIGASEEVTVTTTGPLLQTEDANVGTEIASKQIEELPLNFRNVIGLVMLNSSVNNQTQQQILNAGGGEDTADQDMSFLSFGGGLFGTTAWLLDGGWNVASGWGGTVYVPAVDDTAEVKVTNNSFSAEYGWSTGNVVNMITKSGTSDFHFVIDEFLRNPKLDANTYFNKLNGKPWTGDHRNQFGVAGGGPLYIPGLYKQHDKTFFFANFEGLRLNGSGAFSGYNMPTSSQEGGDFSATLGGVSLGTDCAGNPVYAGEIFNPYSTTLYTTGPCAGHYGRSPYPGNKIPSSGVGAIDSLAKTFATGNYWPAPNQTGKATNFYQTATQATTSNEIGIRIDHNFNSSSRIYGRYSNKHEAKAGMPAYYGASDVAGPEDTNPDNRYSIALGGSHVFTPTFVVSGTVSYNRWTEGNNVQSAGFQPSTLGLPGILDSYSPQFPEVQFSSGNYAALGPQGGFGKDLTANNVGTAALDVNKTHGAHSLSFGYMGIVTQLYGGRAAPTVFNFSNAMTSGPWADAATPGTGDAFASFMAGAGAGGANNAGSTGFNALPATEYYLHGAYIQDDWKTTRKLTLNLGFRYEMQTPFTERHNWQAAFDFHALNPISVTAGVPVYGELVYSNPGHRNLYNFNWDDVAPRVGFAYAITPKLVARGGFGLYYARNFLPYGGIPSPGFSSTTAWTSSVNGYTVTQPLAQAFSGGLTPITGNSLAGLTQVGQGLSEINDVRIDPRIKQFMFGFQYSLTANNLLDVNYVGNRGTHIALGGMNYGQLNPSYLSMGSTALNASVTDPFTPALQNLGLAGMSCESSKGNLPKAQMLEPYPEFCGGATAQQEPVGFSNYNSLQATFTHRVTLGLIFMASYTYAKFIDDAGDALGWSNISGGGASIRNYYDLKADKSVDGTDIPQSLALNYVYELPVGKGKKFGGGMNNIADTVVGGWQISGITHVQAGFPLSISNANGNSASLWGGNQHANLTGAGFKTGTCGDGTPVGTKFCFLNGQPANKGGAFEQAPGLPLGAASAAQIAAAFGNAPRYFSNLRAPGFVDEDLGIQKWFNIPEKFRLQLVAQMFNAFNHVNFTSPDVGIGDSTMGLSSGTMGARQVQLSLKLVR
jgi:hypothetical protein